MMGRQTLGFLMQVQDFFVDSKAKSRLLYVVQ